MKRRVRAGSVSPASVRIPSGMTPSATGWDEAHLAEDPAVELLHSLGYTYAAPEALEGWPNASAFHLSPIVGLLHSMTASGDAVHEDDDIGTTYFLVSRTRYCRVTSNSLRVGFSKSKKRTVCDRLPSPRSCSRAMP
jgi:hypothetical protein